MKKARRQRGHGSRAVMMSALVASTFSTRVATPLEARERPRSRYEEAIAGLPADLRDYTDAEDVITRALTTAVRASDGKEPRQNTQASAAAASPGSSTPLPLLVLVGLSFALLAAGGLAYISRRRQAGRDGNTLQ